VAKPRNLLRKFGPSGLLAILAGAAGAAWLAVVAWHDPDGAFGQSFAAWTQAVLSVGAILVAIAIDQGSSRRDRQARLEEAAEARTARIKVIRAASQLLDSAARVVAARPFKRGQSLDEGLAFEAVVSIQRTLRHFVDRGSDDPALIWVLHRAATELDGGLVDLRDRRWASRADQLDVARAVHARAQELRELLDEYEGGVLVRSDARPA
jgi:hypothetical protein